ncbi:MAG: XTP/dITP diphosphatase [Candidatus Omnitrophota bacterium]
MVKLVIATRNHNKKSELVKLLKGLKVKILTLEDFKEAPCVEEDGDTFKANAVKKAKEIADYTGFLTLADDSGLEVDAIGGAPGVYSARFSGKGANDAKNNRKLLKLIKGIPEEKRKARFVCTIAVAKKNKLLKVVTATVFGRIAEKTSGVHGFGYDPVFIPRSFNKTFAELGPEIKDKISHRAKALEKAKKFLTEMSR